MRRARSKVAGSDGLLPSSMPFAQEKQAPSESLEGHLPVTAEAGQQLAELEAQLEAEAGLKLQLLERVHHLESQVNVTCDPPLVPVCHPLNWQLQTPWDQQD